MKLRVQADRVVVVFEATQQIYHAAKKRSAWPDDFGSVVKVANQGLKLLSATPSTRGPRFQECAQPGQFVLGEARHLILRIQLDSQNHQDRCWALAFSGMEWETELGTDL